MRMWKWVSENLPKWFSKMTRAEKQAVVEDLKTKWLEQNRFTSPISHDCFFCAYDGKHNDDCSTCPARQIKPTFHCTDKFYCWGIKPKNFYREIARLNLRRKRNV